jgi:hypothetical protein
MEDNMTSLKEFSLIKTLHFIDEFGIIIEGEGLLSQFKPHIHND